MIQTTTAAPTASRSPSRAQVSPAAVNAFHEAGHAVVGHLFGRRIDAMTVRRHQSTSGRTSVTRHPLGDRPHPRLPEVVYSLSDDARHVIVLCAGKAGEGLAHELARVDPIRRDLDAHLSRVADTAPTKPSGGAVMTAADASGSDHPRALSCAMTLCGDDLPAAAAFVSFADAIARLIVTRHHVAVEQLAAAVHCAGTLDHDEIVAAINGTEAPGRVTRA